MNIKYISKPLIIGATATALISAVGGYVWKQDHRPKLFEMYVFSLKSGRSIFIRTPNDVRILIDGGANSDIVAELTKILPFYSRRMDTIIATNSDGKNITGLIEILNRYSVGRAYIPKYTSENIGLSTSTNQTYQVFLDALNKHNIQPVEISSGDQADLDRDVKMKILFPVSNEEFVYSKAGPPQLVLNVAYKSNTLTLVGDISKKIQKYVAQYLDIQGAHKTNVMAFSNNVSIDSVSPDFIDILNPEYLVYAKSVTSKTSAKGVTNSTNGANKKTLSKKPKEDPLKDIPLENRLNIREKGTIHFISDGIGIKQM